MPESVPPDSPTPVPMPPTGADSNAVVSNQGDTIELVIHSPHKSLLHHRRPSGWFGSFARGGDDGGGDGDGDRDDHGGRPESQLFSTTGEAEDVDEGRQERGQRRHVMNTTESPSSSGDYDDALSILSASELTNAHDLETAVMAAGAPPAETGVANNGGAPSGRLADAFSEKWGAWVRDTNSSDDGSAGGEGTGRRGYGHGCPSLADNGTAGSAAGTDGGASGRSAREFDHEALLLNPFDPHPVVGTTDPASAAAVEATDSDDGGNSRFASPLSRSSSSGSVDNERWLWRRRDGVKPPTSSGNSSGNTVSQCGDTTFAGGPENGKRPPGNIIRSDAEAKTSSRNESGEGLNAIHGAVVVGLQCETKMAAAEPPSDAQRHDGAGREPTTASLLEIEI